MPVIRLKRNRDCDGPIDRRQPFKGSHMFGTWENGLYVVYSYGRHFPMVVYDPSPCAWFHNSDRYSNSTSRHQTYAGRRGEPKNTDTLKRLIDLGGVTAMVNHIIKTA